MATDLVTIGFKADTGGLTKAQKELDKTAKAGAKVDSSTSKAGKSIGSMGKSAGQASIQIQQFVGQVQGGTSATVALSQQAADLGIVLGFPLLGAVTGIAAAFAGPLITSLMGAGTSVDELQEKLEKLAETQILTKEQAEFLALQERESINDRKESIKSIQDEIKANEGRIASINAGTGQTLRGERAKAAVIERTGEALIKQRADLSLLVKEQKEAENRLKSYELASKGLVKQTKEQEESTKSISTSLEAQIIALRDGESAALAYSIAQSLGLQNAKDLPPEIAKQISEVERLTAAKKGEAAARREATKAETEANRESAKAEAGLSSLINQVDNLGGSWSRTGNIIVDSFGDAADVLNNFNGQMSDLVGLEADLKEARKDHKGDSAKLAKIDESIAEVQQKQIEAQVSGYGDLAGAAASFFDKKTAAYKVAHGIEMGLRATEMAMALTQTSVDVAAGAARMFAQSGWGGFAGVAAMLGVMASLGHSGGGGGGGSKQAQTTGTVLGDSGAESTSLSSADELLDVQIDQLAELRGIREAVSSVESLTTSLAATIVRIGDIGKLTKEESAEFAAAAGLGGSDSYPFAGGEVTGISVVDGVVSMVADIKQHTQNSVKTIKDVTVSINNEITSSIYDIMDTIRTSVSEGADVLGVNINSDLIDAFTFEIGEIDLKGLTGDEISEKLTNVFSTQADLLAESLIPSITEYQNLGEGAFEALVRVSQEQAVFNDALDIMGITLQSGSLGVKAFTGDVMKIGAAAEMFIAQSVIDLVGGIESFSEYTSTFFDEFLSESEQFAISSKSLAEAMSVIGLAVPETREELTALVQGYNLSTEAQREQYAALLELLPALDDYYDTVESGEKEKIELQKQSRALSIAILKEQGLEEEALMMERADALAALDESLRPLQEQLWDAADAAAEAGLRLEAASMGLELAELVGTADEIKEAQEAFTALSRSAALEKMDESLRGLQEALWDAEDAAAKAAKEEQDLANARELTLKGAGMELELIRLVETDEFVEAAEKAFTELSRSAALEEMDESLRDLQVSLWNAQDAAAEAADKEERLANARQEQLDTVDLYLDALASSIDLEKDRAESALDAAKAQYDAQILFAEQSQTTLDEQLATLQDGASLAEEALNKSFDAEISAINETTQARLNALSSERSSIENSLSSVSSLANRIQQAAGGEVSAIDALEAARRGDFSLAERLDLSSSLDASGFSSASEQAIAEATRAFRVSEIGSLASNRASALERQLSAIDRQTSIVQSSADSQIAELEAQRDALLGVDNTVLSLSDAITGYQDAQLALDSLNYDEQSAMFDSLIDIANDELAAAESYYDTEIARLDSIFSAAQEQVDTLNGVNTAVLSVNESVTNLANAISAAYSSASSEQQSSMLAAQQSIASSSYTTAKILNQIQSDVLDVRVVS